MMDDDDDCVCGCPVCGSAPPEVWRDRLTMLQGARATEGSDDEVDMAVEVIEQLSLREAQNLVTVSAQLLMAAWVSMNGGDDDETGMFMDDLEKAFADGSS